MEDKQKRKKEKLRKMLSTAALSVAVISWYTTASGLNLYVFTHLWQAYVISAALQGALFSLSLQGFDILIGLKKAWKKILFAVVWICLLATSSIFSYIYISGDVYSDKLLREDAQKIFDTYCLEKNYELFSLSNELLNGTDDKGGIEAEMLEYVKTLAITENGIELSQNNNKQIQDMKDSLMSYSYSETNVRGNEKSNYANTIYIINYIDVVLTGKYIENDIESLKKEIQNAKETITYIEARINSNIELKQETASHYQNRLGTFIESVSDSYKDLRRKLDEILDEIDSLQDNLVNLNMEKELIDKVDTMINNIVGSMESDLYRQVLQIRSEMNAEEINTESMQQIAEEIYNILLENNITADDERLIGYAQFKSNIKKYEVLIQTRKGIEKEIDELYTLTNVTEEIHQEETSTSNMELAESSVGDVLTADKDLWINYWKNHLDFLKHSIQTLYIGDFNLSESEIDELNGSIESIEVRERLYLSDLNDFERAFSLLFGSNPKHPYKTLLLFSFCFSFGIDLFSVLMSFLLYIFRTK